MNIELGKFLSCMDSFDDYNSMVDKVHMEHLIWRQVHGGSASLLQKLAAEVLSQSSSSSCCERNWSTYSFIQSMKRNNLLLNELKI